MVAKILGLASGALVASVGVWAFNEWRTVTDADRLQTVIADHCLPFVATGTVPFSDMGRPVGVYDDANLQDDITDGGNAILFDNRFVAQWGNTKDGTSNLRVCIVNDSYARADSVGFAVDTATLPAWIDTVIGETYDLAAVQTDAGVLPALLIWEEPDVAQYSGLRLYLTVQADGISNVLIVDDFDR